MGCERAKKTLHYTLYSAEKKGVSDDEQNSY